MFNSESINRKLSAVFIRTFSKQGLLDTLVSHEMRKYDSLTGVATLAYLMDFGNKVLEKGACIVVLVIGLDNLKYYNDTYGHILADNLLSKFAHKLQVKSNSMKAVVGRLGGDEFVVLKEIKDPIKCISLKEEIYNSLKDELFSIDSSIEPIKVSFSIGEAFKINDKDITIHRLLQKAEDDMRYNKFKSRSGMIDALNNGEIFKNQSGQLLKVLAEKDMYTYLHSQSVAKYAVALAESLNLSEEMVEDIHFAGWLHDIGKIIITSEILRKPSRLDDAEYYIIKQHVNNGLNIINTYDCPGTVKNAILYHHERWDGKGYPNGIPGTETPIEGRILQIVDAFSAMTVKRVYREQLSEKSALDEIIRNSGTQFDPEMARIFVDYIKSKKIAI